MSKTLSVDDASETLSKTIFKSVAILWELPKSEILKALEEIKEPVVSYKRTRFSSLSTTLTPPESAATI